MQFRIVTLVDLEEIDSCTWFVDNKYVGLDDQWSVQDIVWMAGNPCRLEFHKLRPKEGADVWEIVDGRTLSDITHLLESDN